MSGAHPANPTFPPDTTSPANMNSPASTNSPANTNSPAGPGTTKENGMRRITLWLVSTVAALVLLFSYRTSTMGVGGAGGAVAAGQSGTDRGGAVAGADPGGDGNATSGGTTGSGTGSGNSGSSPGNSNSGSSQGSSGGSAGSGTFDGSVAQTRWGPVRVRITVSAGKITKVDAVQVPDGNFRDQQINDHAVPILAQRTIQAQSAQIDSVSGATVTSDGYRESLQAAIDAAHLR